MSLSRPGIPSAIAVACLALLLSACGGGDDNHSQSASTVTPLAIPAPPADPGFVDSAPVQASVLPFVDNIATNQRGDARYATVETNAGVRLVKGFLDVWEPLTRLVDAGAPAAANGSFPAVAASTWTGLPNDGTAGGSVTNAAAHNANIQYVINATTQRTAAQAEAAYYDDRRGKNYSVTDGMGPLTAAWRAAAQQTTTITSIPADATMVKYDDGGNNAGVAGAGNAAFGDVITMVNKVGDNASTEPAKRFYKYARPYRWSSSVILAPTLVPAISADPTTDGGFISGHTAEALRNAVVMAYLVPERFQEMLSRGMELGENRILAGMHSPLDVIGGRMLGIASAAANLFAPANATLKASAYAQAHTTLMAATGTTPATFRTFAQSGTASNDRFTDYAANKANFMRRMTFGFAQIGSATADPVVPKGAEVMLETRFPYLSADQRRVVLKTTEIASGYPVMDDAEGWGRLNLFAAGDGYGAFNGNVVVSMDASKGGFNAGDIWRNDIAGAGKFTLSGTGNLKLGGANTYSGGTQVAGGALEAVSAKAFGTGDVYLGAGSVIINAPQSVAIAGKYTQLADTTLDLRVGPNGRGRMTVAGVTTIAGGTLRIAFVDGYAPKAGDTIAVITGSSIKGQFATVTVDGYKATPVYSSNGVQIRIDG
ncbi:autotransporter-associated beta strand repeat-containing protein [Ralstonia sp. 25mfcol4.1]|uniref:acid phosphatase n=1 Tax=Burkholderiaceae TaxID=119060 RepID=UPI000885933A|nr:phosphatase PAP2 family protein [Ralstonia sp. 25mfcol4.1]SDP50104.1 autotransporter-associated beta strand repeat-containing protein [Ralstonia sp. 25mfcol4.1]